MKIPAIRARSGVWTYYISYLTYEHVASKVEEIGQHLHKSRGLSDLIQRSITDNYKSIREYILKQDERFFNSLVLAVYDGEPFWIEVQMTFQQDEFFNLGFLEYSGMEKIFPVDGQHRVEGIKAALEKKPELAKEKVPIVLIGHKNTPDGMQKSRRLFTTLNRYAKPVSLRDIIALDEDDSVAINTRFLVEEFPLFNENNVVDTKGKAIPTTNKQAITSIITLYQCNYELMKLFYFQKKGIKPSGPKLKEYLKFRPSDFEIDEFKQYVVSFWEDFVKSFDVIRSYLLEKNDSALNFRNSKVGGNLLFRPKGLLPFVKACVEIKKRTNNTFEEIFSKLKDYSFNLSEIPWLNILWNNIEKKMIMNSDRVVYLLFIYLNNEKLLTQKELKTLKEGYGSKIGLDEKEIENALNHIK